MKKVSPGDPLKIPASDYNNIIDTANDFLKRQHPVRSELSPEKVEPDVVLIRNSSGVDVSRFHVLGISGIVISPTDNLNEFQNHACLTGVSPTCTHAGKFVVVLEPIEAGQIGRAVIDGVVPVQVTGTGDYAGVADGVTTSLRSDSTGTARVLYRDTKNNWALVRIGNGEGNRRIRFTIDSVNTTSGGSGGSVVDSVVATVDASLCGAGSVPEEDDNDQVTIYDGLGCLFDETPADLIGLVGFASYMNSGSSSSSSCDSCRWEVDQLCCPTFYTTGSGSGS